MLNSLTTLAKTLSLMLLAGILCACSDGNDGGGGSNSALDEGVPGNAQPASREATELLEQFGSGAQYISEQGLQAMLDLDDTSSPISLLQLMKVSDEAGFGRYERELESLLERFGASVEFISVVENQLIGERPFDQARVIRFPNTAMLLDTVRSAEFTQVMNSLFRATQDHAWLLGYPANLPFEVSGGFVDERLARRNRQQAMALLSANSGGTGGDSLAAQADVIIDMIVSDSPEPFYMVNLISFREQAQYADGRQTDLTGMEANNLYTEAVVPQLLAKNSGPVLAMDVVATLTRENTDWQQVAIARYASRDAFLNIFALNPAAPDTLVHKDAGVADTLVYATNLRHTQPPEPVTGNRYDTRYCQLVTFWAAGGIESSYATTEGRNDCPQERLDNIPDEQPISSNLLKPISGTRFKNGPLFHVMDWRDDLGTTQGQPIVINVGSLGFLEAGSTHYIDWAWFGPYTYASFSGSHVIYYSAGRRVYELQDPMDDRFIMHSYSQQVDPSLSLDDLEELGRRLELPEGWRFSTRVLTNTLAVPNGGGLMVRDELRNTYLRLPSP